MIWVLFGPNFPKLLQCPKYPENENQHSLSKTVWDIGVGSLTLLTNRESQVFLINRNATVKLSSINIIHVKKHVAFFIFKFTLK